jgi:signal transduction histidine kinase
MAIHALAPCDHVQYSAVTDKWWLVRERATRSGGVIITYVDITALKQSEHEVQIARTEAEIADRAKTEFLSHLSHELRTPLNAVVGFAELLGNGIAGPLNDRQQSYAGDIAQAGRSMLSLVGDILNLSLLAGDSYVLKDEDVDLAAVLAELAARHADRAAAGRVTVAAVPAVPRVRGDGLALKFVLDNLLSNAIKFSPEGAAVAIDAAVDAAGLTLTIADRGPGIEGALLRHVFEPFQRRTAATAREAKGFGLGLAVGQGFLHLHGGSLEIESRPGRGTVATLRLPPDRLLA